MITFKWKLIATMIISICSLSIAILNPSVAEVYSSSSLNIKQEQNSKVKCKKLNQAQVDEMRIKKLTYIAKYFDIETEGKSLEQLKQEVEQAKRANPEKWILLKKELHEKKLKLLEQKSQRIVK